MVVQRDALAPRGDFKLYAAAGHFADWSPVNKFGRNVAVGTSEEDVWIGGALLNWQAAAATHTILSTSTDDVGGATPGSGARTVQIFGLDANGADQNETVTLDGQTGKDTASTYLRINRMVVLTAGSGLTNAGAITAEEDGGGTVYAQIAAADGQTLQAGYTIPAGKVGYMTNLVFSTGQSAKTSTFRVLSRDSGGVWVVKYTLDVTESTASVAFDGELNFGALCDVRIAATAAAGQSNACSAAFSLFLSRDI
jgi:hypothetical protein